MRLNLLAVAAVVVAFLAVAIGLPILRNLHRLAALVRLRPSAQTDQANNAILGRTHRRLHPNQVVPNHQAAAVASLAAAATMIPKMIKDRPAASLVAAKRTIKKTTDPVAVAYLGGTNPPRRLLHHSKEHQN
jgi:hypothetical protein